MASSSSYLINDLFDQDHDKAHHLKSRRSISSGKLEVKHALSVAVILAAASCGFSLSLDVRLSVIIAAYLVLNILYSKWFKHIVYMDVLCLGMFFALRLLAGSSTAGIPLSPWILSLVVLQVFFFGFNKRLGEFRNLGQESQEHRLVLGQYNSVVIGRIMLMTTAVTLILYAFYSVSAPMIERTGNLHMLLTAPFFYMGIFRYLFLLKKSPHEEEVARLIFSDRFMQIDIIFWLAAVLGVIDGRF